MLIIFFPLLLRQRKCNDPRPPAQWKLKKVDDVRYLVFGNNNTNRHVDFILRFEYENEIA